MVPAMPCAQTRRRKVALIPTAWEALPACDSPHGPHSTSHRMDMPLLAAKSNAKEQLAFMRWFQDSWTQSADPRIGVSVSAVHGLRLPCRYCCRCCLVAAAALYAPCGLHSATSAAASCPLAPAAVPPSPSPRAALTVLLPQMNPLGGEGGIFVTVQFSVGGLACALCSVLCWLCQELARGGLCSVAGE